MEPPVPDDQRRPRRDASKRLYVLWGISLALTAALGLVLLLVVLPLMRLHEELRTSVVPHLDPTSSYAGAPPGEVVDRLGGPGRGAGRLSLYLRLPQRVTGLLQRRAAALTLKYCGSPARPALERCLEGDHDPFVRMTAAEGIGDLHPPAESSIPLLVEALKDPDRRVRSAAAWAAVRTCSTGKEAVAPLTAVLEAPVDIRAIAAAARKLGLIGAAAKGSVPSLLKTLSAAEWWARAEAAEALGKIGPAAGGAVEPLVRALADESARVRLEVSRALAAIGPPPRASLPALVTALGAAELRVRIGAARALGRMGPAAKDAVPDLVAALDGEEWYFRCAAIWALGEIGPAARKAVPALEKALEDRDKDVREEARKALKKIGGGAPSPAP